MISVGKMFVTLLSMKTSVAVPIRKSSAVGERKFSVKQRFQRNPEIYECVFERTIKPVHVHCFAVVIAETTELWSQDFHSHITGS